MFNSNENVKFAFVLLKLTKECLMELPTIKKLVFLALRVYAKREDALSASYLLLVVFFDLLPYGLAMDEATYLYP